jgi:hypothetical protein
MDRFLRPAVPDMKVRLILPTLLSEVEPSIPTMDPLTIPPTGALTLLKSSFMLALEIIVSKSYTIYFNIDNYFI